MENKRNMLRELDLMYEISKEKVSTKRLKNHLLPEHLEYVGEGEFYDPQVDKENPYFYPVRSIRAVSKESGERVFVDYLVVRDSTEKKEAERYCALCKYLRTKSSFCLTPLNIEMIMKSRVHARIGEGVGGSIYEGAQLLDALYIVETPECEMRTVSQLSDDIIYKLLPEHVLNVAELVFTLFSDIFKQSMLPNAVYPENVLYSDEEEVRLKRAYLSVFLPVSPYFKRAKILRSKEEGSYVGGGERSLRYKLDSDVVSKHVAYLLWGLVSKYPDAAPSWCGVFTESKLLELDTSDMSEALPIEFRESFRELLMGRADIKRELARLKRRLCKHEHGTLKESVSEMWGL